MWASISSLKCFLKVCPRYLLAFGSLSFGLMSYASRLVQLACLGFSFFFFSLKVDEHCIVSVPYQSVQVFFHSPKCSLKYFKNIILTLLKFSSCCLWMCNVEY